MSPEAQAFEAVAELFERLGVQYCIVGSVAAYSHGHGCATVDVDIIVAQIERAHAHEMAQKLASEYYISEEAVGEAIVCGGSFNLIHHATGLKIDVFVRNEPIYER